MFFFFQLIHLLQQYLNYHVRTLFIIKNFVGERRVELKFLALKYENNIWINN